MTQKTPETRVYPLTASPDFTEEEIAVTFAMTSRRPEPFDEIAKQVTAQKAADFHEKWVLDYGHASVAEHAIVHLAVENISRVACDVLEDNRLASYTEKSSRYQVMDQGSYHTPRVLGLSSITPKPHQAFQEACNTLFTTYADIVEQAQNYLSTVHPQAGNERQAPYNLRLRRIATDHCRAILPAATLTNVGITANARTLEHAVSKLLSHELMEVRALGKQLASQAREVVPTLLKYAAENPYLKEANNRRHIQYSSNLISKLKEPTRLPIAQLVHHDVEASEKIAAAIIFNSTPSTYAEAWRKATVMHPLDIDELIAQALKEMGPHDTPPREFESVSYTFELLMDYGALREFRRHRIQTQLSKYLTIREGYSIPPVVRDAGLTDVFQRAIENAEQAFLIIERDDPATAQYLVTHAHNQRVLSTMNLRECYHLFKIRTSKLAHFAIREPVNEAMKLAVNVHPNLFKYLQLRDYPEWWPIHNG